MTAQTVDPKHEPDTPPVFGSWGRWYAVVLVELAVIIAAAYFWTEAFR